MCSEGSNPSFSAHRGVAQLVSAPALGAGGPQFESEYPDFAILAELVDAWDLKSHDTQSHRSSSLLGSTIKICLQDIANKSPCVVISEAAGFLIT